MPRSSVFVRLNWPSKSDDSSFESEASPQVQGALPSLTSRAHVEKTSSSSSGDSFERNTPDLESSALSSYVSPVGDIRGEKYTKNVTGTKVKIKCHPKPSVERGTEPPHWPEGIQPSSSCTAAIPSCGGSQSLDSTSGSCSQHSGEISHTPTTDNPAFNAAGPTGNGKRVGTGSLKAAKPKTKPKPRHLTNKSRKISRSLSASCVSVSTNTDPRDFVELAKVSATLPIRRRVKDPKSIAARTTENKAVSCSLDLEEICQAEHSFASETENKDNRPVVEETFFQKIVYPCAQTPCSSPLPDFTEKKRNKCEYDFQPIHSVSLPNSPTVHDKPITVASEYYTADDGEDSVRGYIELPTYVPSGTHHPLSNNNEGVISPCTVLPDDKHPILSLLSNTFQELSVEDAPYIDDEMFAALGCQQESVEPRLNINLDDKVGGYTQSGYPELDSALLPPNGQDPYRNTPSPGLHGVPQDRYDPGLEGDYPDDGRYPGNDPGMGCPPDGVVYGRLLGTPRSPYTLNGGVVGSSAEPLLPSPGLYDEEPHSAPHPAPPPHMSPPTPSLPPPPVQNHDNYAHPNLLRSPSADSGAPRVQWRDPDLHEVIDFLSNPNNVVKANAAAYLQHLCYMDDPTKQKTRILGGIPPLVALLSHDLPELHRNACGALRNLSYGRQNDENKRAIKDASGIPALVRLLRKTPDNEIKELVTGILWNLSSCEDLKHSIIDDALTVIVSHVIIPCSGWDGGEVERDPNVDVWWSTVFKNASGVLRNVSSAGEYARTKLRQCNGLVDSLLTVIKSAIAGASHDNKSVENCVCILRNLSYRCQEVEDPNYDKNQPPTQSRATATAKGDNLGCFGGSRKKKEAVGGAMKETSTGQRSTGPRTEPLRGMELLWQPEVVVGPYLALLSDCSNPETLEAAAGALQNLAACYWQPSIDVRAAVRKEKGLPILVELLRMEVDRVVCAVATALRNLAIDQRNKELIGKYAMRELVQKLPSGNTHDTGTSDETIAAVLATLNEVIKKNAEFSRSLLDFGGVDRLVNMTRLRGRYSVRVVKFASQVLFSMWGHQELREVYKKQGWKEQDFVSKSVAARNASGGGANSPTANNTLNRPMASQGGTRYEDKTIQRGQGKAHQQREQLPMSDMGYGGDGGIVPQAGGVRLYPPVQGKPGEPVYAKVNRDKKRNRQYDGLGPQYGTLGADDWSGPVYSGSPTATPNFNNASHNNNNNTNNNGVVLDSAEGQAGDSWV